MEIASFDWVFLPDGTRIQSGDPVFRLASLWPLRHRPGKDGMGTLTGRLSEHGKWYEGAGNLWVYARENGQLEYFDLSADAASALGGPGGI